MYLSHSMMLVSFYTSWKYRGIKREFGMKWVFWGIFQKRVLLLRKRKRLPFRKEYVIFTWYPLLPFNCRKLMIYSVEVDLIFPPTFSLVADSQIFTLFRSLLYQKTTSLSCITSFNLNVIFTSTKLLHWIFLLVTSLFK